MSKQVPNREELVHRALLRHGNAPDQELVAVIEREYGVKIDARFLPVFRASLLARELAEAARTRARATAGPAETPPPTPLPPA